ncbi:hypothetical protein [Paracoccus litorisediminis]|uniref:Phage protein n=1 Tax=Paracoccus litorisediminis TaxID=2006130 RepID=A0A844HMQ5_9RHOB|nr:hypothetical protein [Paracoccus litorisediminis]MTH61200.1 hypothetical protein [Paracoccus litorisediminis]
MTPTLKVHGDWGHIELMFRNAAEKVPRTARKTMWRSARRILARAKEYTPEDFGFLEDSIRIEQSYGARGRLQLDIVMGGKTVLRPDTVMGRMVDLDQYALIIHEFYDQFRPGQGTKYKRSLGMKAGGRFLTRAFSDDNNQLERDMVTAVERMFDGRGNFVDREPPDVPGDDV